MSFDCKYKQKEEQCSRLNRRCSPGDKGCVLNGKVEFSSEKDKKKPVKGRIISSSILLLLLFSLASCGIALPESEMELAGRWGNHQVELNIYANGRVEYYINKGASNYSLEAPLQEVEGDVLKVGLGSLVKKIHIDRRPWEEEGKTWMVVDGRKLQRYDY